MFREPMLNADLATGLVVIGRNEGERLKRCLASTAGIETRIYVDSGSTDGSTDHAAAAGVIVENLAVPPAFTAARARNSGLARLLDARPDIAFVQMLDGDCELATEWLSRSVATLGADPGLAAVVGRLRERFPERSVYNAMCDHEWDGPAGDAPGFGGIALFRAAALLEVGGYAEDMIAGEDTEMAMRMRKRGWRILRIDSAMALHDANILRFGQWWRRARRGGHGFGEMAHRHPDARWPNWRRTCRSIVAWGGVLPLLVTATLALAIVRTPLWLAPALMLLAAWPLKMGQIYRSKRRAGLSPRLAWSLSAFLLLGKVPELIGLAQYHVNRLRGSRTAIIEYKTGPSAAHTATLPTRQGVTDAQPATKG